jgi:hypothetical protein
MTVHSGNLTFSREGLKHSKKRKTLLYYKKRKIGPLNKGG